MGLSLLIIIPPILVHVFIPKVLIFLFLGGGFLFLGLLPNECSNLEVFAQYIYLALSNQSIDRLL